MRARILIVEDEPIIRLDLELQLERLGHRVVGMAARGEEAVAKAMELKPDLVLMDVHLDGGMDGMEAARRIRAAQDVRVVYVTAHVAPGNADQQDTAAPLLTKPFRIAELAATIERTLAAFPNGNTAGEDSSLNDSSERPPR